jgi:hypothetical protein
MSLFAISGGFLWPMEAVTVNGSLAISSVTLDAADEKATVVMLAPKAGDISKLWFRLNTVGTGGPTSVSGRVETVSTTNGNPSGTLWATNTSGTVSVAATDDNVWMSVTLTAAATVALDDPIALVITNPGTQSIQLVTGVGGAVTASSSSVEYSVPYTTSYGTKTSTMTAIGIEYSDGTIYFPSGVYPFDEVASSVGSASVSDGQQAGNKIVMPFAGTISALGLQFVFSTTRGNIIGKVYRSTDLTNPVATTVELDRDIQSTTSGTRYQRLRVTPFNVAIGDIIYVVLQASGAAVSLGRMQFKASWAESTRPGYDGQMVRVTRAGTTGAFTEVTNEIAEVALYFSHIDNGTGPGSASFNLGVV